jgi:cytoskeletal protein CcmA (bactofilin family)
MKRFSFLTKLLFGLCLVLISSFLLARLVVAQENQQSGETVVVPQDRTINEDYFAAARSIVVQGTINGDAYLAGGEVVVSGVAGEDLLVVGGTVTITGRVAEDIRVIGGQVTISGEVGGNITASGGNVTIADSARVGGSLVSAGGNVTVLAPIAEGVNIFGGRVLLANTIGGNANIIAQELTLTSNAQIAGTLTRNPLPQGPMRQPPDEERIAGFITRTALTLLIIDLVSSLIIGLILLYLFPVATRAIVDAIGQKPLGVLGIGLLILILVPFVIFLLFATVVGIPLALILTAIFLIAMYLTKIYIALFIGRLILRKAALGWAFLLGLVLYEIVSFIPFVGLLLGLFTLLFGLGAIFWGLKNVYQGLRSKNEI